MTRILSIVLASFTTMAVAGCGSSEEKPEPTAEPSSAPLTRYDGLPRARTDAEVMLGKLEVEEKDRTVLLSEFDRLLADAEVAAVIKEKGISAVCASVGGSGGLVVKVGGASGLACFAGGRQAVPVDVVGWTAGASGGGEKVVALGIVCGLKSEKDFPGGYNVTIRGAAGGQQGSRLGKGVAKSGSHELHWVGTAVGFGGDVAAGSINVSFAEPPK